MDENTEVLGVRILEDGDNSEDQFDSFTVADIFYIDLFEPKKNYQVPRFYTKKGVFTVLLTLDRCKQVYSPLGVLPLDNGNLVNVDNIDYVTKTPFSLTAHFRGGHKANVAKSNEKLVKHLIRKT